jgi:hypothetical protein
LALVEGGVQDPRVCAIASELARQGQGVDGGCWALMAANLRFEIFVAHLKSGYLPRNISCFENQGHMPDRLRRNAFLSNQYAMSFELCCKHFRHCRIARAFDKKP